jgi:hypothetical protein
VEEKRCEVRQPQKATSRRRKILLPHYIPDDTFFITWKEFQAENNSNNCNSKLGATMTAVTKHQ